MLPEASPLLTVDTDCDVGEARRQALAVARQVGLCDDELHAVGLIVTELAGNLVQHHAVDGQIEVRAVSDGAGRGVQVVALDQGPGMVDIDAAVCDGYSTCHSMGVGLGAVRRLADEFDLVSAPAPGPADGAGAAATWGGTCVVARKWRGARAAEPFRFGASTQAIAEGVPNGDGHLVVRSGRLLLLGVIDGLGHGAPAHRAAEQARRYVQARAEEPLDRLLAGLHEHLRGTRGAAATFVRLDAVAGTVAHAAVGNVEARVYPQAGLWLQPTPGVLGSGALPGVRMNCHSLPSGGVVVLCSDGVTRRWSLDEYPFLRQRHPALVAWVLHRQHRRGGDDATVLVAEATHVAG